MPKATIRSDPKEEELRKQIQATVTAYRARLAGPPTEENLRIAEARERLEQALALDPVYELARALLTQIDKEQAEPAPDAQD